MIITTRRCVSCKKHIAKSLGKVTVGTYRRCIHIRVLPITSSCMVGFENYMSQMIITTRRCVACKNHVARSKKNNVTVSMLSLRVPESCPTLNFIVHVRILKSILHKLSPWQEDVSRVITISLGQRSKSQSARTVCAFQSRVRPITSSCMVGFENYLKEMTNKRRRSVVCKDHVARSNVKVTSGTLSMCIPESCPTHNFIRHGGI